MTSVAEQRLKELCARILQNQSSPKTLAYFRLSNPDIVRDLQEFAADVRDATKKPLSDQVLDLFQRLNHHMAEQERSCSTWGDFFVASKQKLDSQPLSQNEISVVFGGKYNRSPASISEQLISKLVLRSKTVYTVSRSTCQLDELPKNVRHVPKQNLDVSDGSTNGSSSVTNTQGADEFYDVMTMAKEEWLKTSLVQPIGSPHATTTLVFYFTLGQHKGVNPFERNLNSAQNFHRAFEKLDLCSLAPEHCRRSWRVVLTGTDATLPSTHPPSEMSMVTDGNEGAAATVLTVPTYKIGKNNFVYAMSKLGQYHWIANAVARMRIAESSGTDRDEFEEIANETEEILRKICKHVTGSGEDGVYHGDHVDSDSATVGITMEELDSISLKMSFRMKEGLLRDHFRIAEQISICFTPLHAKPWTKDAIESTSNGEGDAPSPTPLSSQKAFVLEQIVKRLKNAISIESAASSHFL